MLSSINRKNKAIILLFLVVVVILALIVGIYYVNDKIPNTPSREKASNEDLTQLIKKLDQITTLEEKEDENYQNIKDSFEAAALITDKKEGFEKFRSGSIRVTILYSSYHNPNLYDYINKDLVDFAKKNYPDQYVERDFTFPCQDPECAKSEIPDEISVIISDLEKSDMEDYYKENFIDNLLNAAYEDTGDDDASAWKYFFTARSIESSSDVTPSGANIEIAQKIYNYVQKTNPEFYKLYTSQDQIPIDEVPPENLETENQNL